MPWKDQQWPESPTIGLWGGYHGESPSGAAENGSAGVGHFLGKLAPGGEDPEPTSLFVLSFVPTAK